MPQHNTGELAHDLDALQKDMRQLRADMGEMLSHLSGRASEETSALGGRIKDTGKRALSHTEDAIRDRPLTSVAILFLVGLVLGWLLDRKISA